MFIIIYFGKFYCISFKSLGIIVATLGSNTYQWASLPTKNDPADQVPLKSDLKDGQVEAKVDVFFLHPTIFTRQPKNQYEWNADVKDSTMNQSVDNSTILNQASAFNGSGKIYAPRYRQAHYHAFVTADKDDKKKSLDVAYSDVKASFEYYLKNYRLYFLYNRL